MSIILLVESVAKVETAHALREVDGKLECLLPMQLPEEQTHNLVVIRDSISSALSYIESLPKDIDLLAQIIKQVSEKNNPHCAFAIKRCAEIIRDDLIKEERNWVTKYLDVAEKNYQNMSSSECTSWLEKTKMIPVYIRSSTKERYSKVRELIEKQLHDARVAGLLSMYDALTPAEKAEFKKLLSQR